MNEYPPVPEELEKEYATPYGKRSSLLLRKALDAYCREDKAFALIRDMLQAMEDHAPQDATHDGLTNCEIMAQARAWMELRENQINMVDNLLD